MRVCARARARVFVCVCVCERASVRVQMGGCVGGCRFVIGPAVRPSGAVADRKPDGGRRAARMDHQLLYDDARRRAAYRVPLHPSPPPNPPLA